MKKITLKIDDNVFNELKTNQGFRIMLDSSYGIQDEFIQKIISSIEDGGSEVKIEFKENK